MIWQCNNKFKNKKKCKTPHLTEEQIKKEFVKAFNNLISNKDEIIKNCKDAILELTNTKNIDDEISKLQKENESVINLMKNLIYENSRKAIDQAVYNEKYDSYTGKYEKIKSELSKLEDKKQDLKVCTDRIKIFIENLKSSNKLIDEFDERLWYTMVDKALAYTNGNLYFQFKCNDHT